MTCEIRTYNIFSCLLALSFGSFTLGIASFHLVKTPSYPVVRSVVKNWDLLPVTSTNLPGLWEGPTLLGDLSAPVKLSDDGSPCWHCACTSVKDSDPRPPSWATLDYWPTEAVWDNRCLLFGAMTFWESFFIWQQTTQMSMKKRRIKFLEQFTLKTLKKCMLHCLHFYNDFFYIIMIFILSFFFWWNLNKICTFNNTASQVNFLLFFFFPSTWYFFLFSALD